MRDCKSFCNPTASNEFVWNQIEYLELTDTHVYDCRSTAINNIILSLNNGLCRDEAREGKGGVSLISWYLRITTWKIGMLACKALINQIINMYMYIKITCNMYVTESKELNVWTRHGFPVVVYIGWSYLFRQRSEPLVERVSGI